MAGEGPAELFSRPPEEGARRLALSFLDEAAAALPRLDDSADSEALQNGGFDRRARAAVGDMKPVAIVRTTDVQMRDHRALNLILRSLATVPHYGNSPRSSAASTTSITASIGIDPR